ncbi:2-C-methyl-D-erythritol 4-phosphate cytidylyltransferase [Shewanella psychrotolerans]|uniref:2-C-methyl-D-erythritol 4-phosphate cytidylyltransferase n=1 Tax=Shewanella psychrotolerans TaxID=2864206 RepID=UPI001C654EC1|nr:2-C-methyl-D-erythritol 4-phosphate cytidylyltransferase [Shewanella psychrotolerans]QYK02372.1 2-C-methyl-D-erythritol 4-phosphate cytidylyltransferase [Shewanella psychrotolerans]
MNQIIEHLVAIVPAAGIGSRIGAEIPKQYLMLNEQPIIAHTLDVLLKHPKIAQVIVAVSPNDSYFAKLPQANDRKLKVVEGGQERADSVLAGLSCAPQSAWALVHDAARPCLHPSDIDLLIQAAEQQSQHDKQPQGAILAMPVRDTMKRSNHQGNIEQTVCRDNLWHALTPQLFPVVTLRDNLTQALVKGISVTDEASAMEWAGFRPKLVRGRADNIKVTHPDDLRLAALFLNDNLTNNVNNKLNHND